MTYQVASTLEQRRSNVVCHQSEKKALISSTKLHQRPIIGGGNISMDQTLVLVTSYGTYFVALPLKIHIFILFLFNLFFNIFDGARNL